MSFVYFNPNPYGKSVGDCVVRALTRVDGSGDWTNTYLKICAVGALVGDMPSANKVWGDYLLRIGFKRYFLPDTCPDCYTIRDFCADHPNGTYVVSTGSHVVAVVDGDYYDTSDTGSEIPIAYFEKEANNEWYVGKRP